MVVSAKKLIQGSVIYMKKMRMSKRGFTLTEIIVVVAIMVIVASAAFVGVAVTLENAKKQRDAVKDTHGQDKTGKELFEAGAWVEIDDWTRDAAKFFGIHYHTPSSGDTGSASPTPTVAAGGPGGGSSVTNTPTTPPTNTPTPSPSPTPTPEVSATPTTKPSGGRVGSKTGTTAVPGSSCGSSGNAWNFSFSIGANAKEFTVYVPFDGIDTLYCNTGNCEVTGSGHYYTVTMINNAVANSSSFGLGGSGVNGDLDVSKVKIVSYVPAD